MKIDYNHKHKKALGQHFLHDKNIIRKIVRESKVTNGTEVLEVGPGEGVLTEELLSIGAKVTAVELDKDLVPILEQRFGDSIKLINWDILRLKWDELGIPEGSAIVANLPYQITSPFVFKAITYRNFFPNITIMIQKEVAERIMAGPGTKAYGILSLKTQFYYNPEYLFTVPPHLFTPPPKVDSAVIRLTPRENQPSIKNEKFFWHLVETSFRNRRKMLRVNLKSILSKEGIASLQESGPIDLTRRGETLNEEEFISLYTAILPLL